MRKMQALIILFQIFYFAAVMGTNNLVFAEAEADLQKKLGQKVQSSRLQQEQLGLIIADEHGDVIYTLNQQKPFMPASLTKIITAAAALEKFPIGHQFITDILAQKKLIQGSLLNGDLYLRGGGDAGFVSESMWFLVNEFSRTGITEIQGDLYVDDSKFDAVRFDASRDQERVDRAYDSPIGAMTFNWSAINVFVRPALQKGMSALIFADPISEYIEVVNKTKTVASGSKTRIEVSNSGIVDGGKKERVVVSGTIAQGASEFVAYKSVVQPEVWAGYQLKSFFSQRGIHVKGQVKIGKAPKTYEVLASTKSRPIGEIVTGMMKFSNNYIAEILTKNLGAHEHGVPGTMDKGIQVLREYLTENNISGVDIFNPSGLSRKNKLSAESLLKVLTKVKANFKLYPEFLSGLPIAGVDGTLRNRLGGQSGSGSVRAKTGHLTGVAGLAGFATAKNGHVYSFVFLFNGSGENAYKSKDLFDQLLREIIN